ncbi:MAG: hypothetical protein PHT33_11550 [bacterium]|nr:hypothetical protein [bacterium]
MRTAAQDRREQTLWNIRQNPTEITITRTTKTPYKGGHKDETAEIGPLIVRIYSNSRRQPQLQSERQGTRITDGNWGMLADWRVDIRCGSDVTDEFETALGRFRVAQVKPQLLGNEIIGYQCDLERVS